MKKDSNFEVNGQELNDTVVSIKRISKTVKGGRTMRFSALVVVGDGNGRIGVGHGKSTEIPEAITIMSPWGEKQHLAAGSFLNITNPGDIYGIAAPEFNETYSILKQSVDAPDVYKK